MTTASATPMPTAASAELFGAVHPLMPRASDDDLAIALGVFAVAAGASLDQDEPLHGLASFLIRHPKTSSQVEAAVDSLLTGSNEWRSLLADFFSHADINTAMVGYTLATVNPLLARDQLELSVVHNRIDALLDSLGVTVTALNIQNVLMDVQEALAEASTSPAVKASVIGGTMTVGAVAGWFGLAGGPVTKAIGSAGGFVSRKLTPESEFVADLSMLCAGTLILWDSGQLDHVHRIRAAVSERLAEVSRKSALQHGGTLGGVDLRLQQRVLRKVVEIMVPEGTDDLTSLAEASLPDLVGMVLEDAKRIVAAHGGECSIFDAIKPDSVSRNVLRAGNWIVVTQTTSPRSSTGVVGVMLGVRKSSDPSVSPKARPHD